MRICIRNPILEREFSKKVAVFLLPLLLLNIQNVFAQSIPCASPIVYFLSTENVSSAAVSDGKIKLYGDVNSTHKVVVSTTALAAPTGNAEFTSAALFSTFANGYIKTDAPNTTQTYYIRVYAPDGSCYTDKSITFEKTNFTSTPNKPDIDVIVAHSGGQFVTKNTAFTTTVSVRNQGTATATGLEVTVTIPAGITIGTATASVGTYNAGTGKWTIPALAIGTTVSLTFANTISTTEGIKFINADLTAETETDLDSSPTTSNIGEDDQSAACVSTPYEYCNGNTIAITLPSYTGIKWYKNGTLITASNSEYTLNANGSLTILSIGDYTYEVNISGTSCPSGGCCPIRVIAAPLPILSLTPSPVTCFGGNNGSINATA
ncbi:DUF11 domain-containing protein, partial [Emticicia sp.]|uniref:DUF11 domain-containing protein n=1 Tax=Emticicia sp. TaxID=1930953 RepID=UPI0037521062